MSFSNANNGALKNGRLSSRQASRELKDTIKFSFTRLCEGSTSKVYLTQQCSNSATWSRSILSFSQSIASTIYTRFLKNIFLAVAQRRNIEMPLNISEGEITLVDPIEEIV